VNINTNQNLKDYECTNSAPHIQQLTCGLEQITLWLNLQKQR